MPELMTSIATRYEPETRTVTWADMGTDVSSAVDLDDALTLSGLDFTVVKKNTAFFSEGANGESTLSAMPEFKATVREEDGRLYGVVTNQYEIVQNEEAFDFVNYIPDFRFSRAGETHKGISYLTGQLPETQILGESYTPELIFRNSFNRSCGVQVLFVPVRGYCLNQFNLKIMNHGNSMSMPHRMSIRERIEKAKNVVATLTDYLEGMEDIAKQYVMMPMSERQIANAVTLLFPYPEDATDRQKDNVQKNRDLLLSIYRNNEDNANFRGTVWGMINAYTDYLTHRPARKTKYAEENRFMMTTSEPVDVSKILEASQN